MATIPSNHRQAERQLIRLIESGELEIEADGTIWRVAIRGGDRWNPGQTRLNRCARRRAEKVLPSGYLMVRGMWSGKRITGLAHRLVWQHFNGLIPDGLVMNHKNGIKSDNRPDNLEVVTYSQNQKHAHRVGLIDQSGERNPGSILSNVQVEEIRVAYATGKYRQVQIARLYGVSYQTISKIVRGERRRSQRGPTDSKDHRNFYGDRDNQGRFVGRRAAGTLLDGKENREMPE